MPGEKERSDAWGEGEQKWVDEKANSDAWRHMASIIRIYLQRRRAEMDLREGEQ